MPYCPKCGYNLEAHALGSQCPECGVNVSRLALSPLPRAWPGAVALLIVVLLPAVLVVRTREPALLLLIGALAAHLTLVVVAYLQHRRVRSLLSRISLILGSAAGAIPLITLVLFLAVFVIGGSSNVAQLAGDSGHDLWSLWFGWWPVLLFGNPISVLCSVAALAIPPYRPRYFSAWALPLAALTAAIAGAHLTVVYFPDA